jgi:hypothetical protein
MSPHVIAERVRAREEKGERQRKTYRERDRETERDREIYMLFLLTE